MATKTAKPTMPERSALELDAAKARTALDDCSIAAERAVGAYDAIKATLDRGPDFAQARDAAQRAQGARTDAVTALRDAQSALDAYDATHQTQ